MPSWYSALAPAHAAYCDYSSGLFPFVPGDPGNPFVALWQATLIDTVTLALATLILFLIGGLARRPGFKRFGYVYLAATVLGGALTIIIALSSRPLACNGAPDTPPLTAGQQHDLDAFSMLGSLAYVAFYVTILLAVVFFIVLLSAPVSRGRRTSLL